MPARLAPRPARNFVSLPPVPRVLLVRQAPPVRLVLLVLLARQAPRVLLALPVRPIAESAALQSAGLT